MKSNGIISSFNTMPRGCNALFFIQIFATMAFAVLLSSLVLYMTSRLDIHVTQANMIMGGFLAFNYGLHLLGGYFGGRLLSYRGLFVVGMLLQLCGCLALAHETVFALYLGLSFFLTGSGLNVTCINMMLSQRMSADDPRREGAFLWNYSGMNIGFFLGFTMAGYFHLAHDYVTLFILSSLGNAISLLILFGNWSKMDDLDTPLSKQTRADYLKKNALGFLLIALMVPSLNILLQHSSFSNALVILVGIGMSFLILYWALQLPESESGQKLIAYLLLSFASLIFWSLYLTAPMGLTVFAEHNVNRHVLGLLISPQWIQNINTIVIVFGAPMVIALMSKLREKGIEVSIPVQFSASLLLIGLGFIVIPIGITFAGSNGLVHFNWIALSYILQSLGELLISPIGYAMIARLAPAKLQGILMGTWMMISGVAGVLASYFSNFAIADVVTTAPLMTNPGYQKTFLYLGITALIAGVILFCVKQFMNKLIYGDSTKSPDSFDESEVALEG